MKEESFSSALWDYLKEQVNVLREWLRPAAEDTLYLKIIKGISKGIVLLILTALSPVVLLILFIAFVTAF